MTADQRLIQNRKFLLGSLVFCLYEVIVSWRAMNFPAPAKYDLVFIIGLIFSAFICVSVLVKTSFIGDRVVAASIAVAITLSVIVRLLLPGQHAVHIIRAVIWFMWVIALFAGIFMLVRYRRGLPREGLSSGT